MRGSARKRKITPDGRPQRTSAMPAKDRRRRIRVLWRAQDGICAICLQPMIHPDQARAARRHTQKPCEVAPHHPTIEHVQLRSEGGRNNLGNLLATHWGCNADRADGPLPACALEMHQRVLAWLRDELGHVPQSKEFAR